ncbi:hypothetical protein BJV78DRAFT_1189297 [Lactifluus subvellereus]|nr:hypothetical protein BJV78DRAFT_1189297 [Lactifluus subvellereus]
MEPSLSPTRSSFLMDFGVSRQAASGSFHAKLKYAHIGKLLKFSVHGSEGVAQAPARYAMPVHETSRVQTAFRSPGQVHLSSYSGGTCAEIYRTGPGRAKRVALPLRLLMTGIVGQIAIYVPQDFRGVVSRRGGLSGASISGSAAAHRLAGLRLNQYAYRDEDEIVVHSTGMVRVCVMGEDPVASRVLAA